MVTLVKDLGMQNVGKRFVRRALLKCDCGTQYIRDMQAFKRGTNLRCKECKSKLRRTHNETNTRLYRIWAGMVQRATNKKRVCSHRYVGRGISVHPKWLKYEPFRNWAISNGYSENLSIDRRNNDGNYEPSNCRWVDMKTQMQNKTHSMKGIGVLPSGNYRVRIRVDGKIIGLGTYSLLDDAIIAYNKYVVDNKLAHGLTYA